MLKDLDQRQAEQVSAQPSHAVPVVANNSSKKVIVIALVIIVLLNVIGLFFWQLYSENQSLKAVQKVNAQSENTISSQKDSPQMNVATAAIQSIKTEHLEVKPIEAKPIEAKPVKTSINETELISPKPQVIAAELIKNAHQAIVNTNKTNDISANSAKANELANQAQPDLQPSLTISRRKMSPQELAKQKFTQAEQAVLSDNINQAEHLL